MGRENSRDRKFCIIKRERNSIIIKIGPNTTLTHLRDSIKKNVDKIKKLQREIRNDLNLRKPKRDRESYVVIAERDREIYLLSKLSIKELRNLAPNKERYANINYKDILIAAIINNKYYQPIEMAGEIIKQKQITSDNIRKIISRQKALMENKK